MKFGKMYVMPAKFKIFEAKELYEMVKICDKSLCSDSKK